MLLFTHWSRAATRAHCADSSWQTAVDMSNVIQVMLLGQHDERPRLGCCCLSMPLLVDVQHNSDMSVAQKIPTCLKISPASSTCFLELRYLGLCPQHSPSLHTHTCTCKPRHVQCGLHHLLHRPDQAPAIKQPLQLTTAVCILKMSSLAAAIVLGAPAPPHPPTPTHQPTHLHPPLVPPTPSKPHRHVQ